MRLRRRRPSAAPAESWGQSGDRLLRVRWLRDSRVRDPCVRLLQLRPRRRERLRPCRAPATPV
eukprot:4678949-Pyramimonas_sp.AAC.1